MNFYGVLQEDPKEDVKAIKQKSFVKFHMQIIMVIKIVFGEVEDVKKIINVIIQDKEKKKQENLELDILMVHGEEMVSQFITSKHHFNHFNFFFLVLVKVMLIIKGIEQVHQKETCICLEMILKQIHLVFSKLQNSNNVLMDVQILEIKKNVRQNVQLNMLISKLDIINNKEENHKDSENKEFINSPVVEKQFSGFLENF